MTNILEARIQVLLLFSSSPPPFPWELYTTLHAEGNNTPFWRTHHIHAGSNNTFSGRTYRVHAGSNYALSWRIRHIHTGSNKLRSPAEFTIYMLATTIRSTEEFTIYMLEAKIRCPCRIHRIYAGSNECMSSWRTHDRHGGKTRRSPGELTIYLLEAASCDSHAIYSKLQRKLQVAFFGGNGCCDGHASYQLTGKFGLFSPGNCICSTKATSLKEKCSTRTHS